MVKRFKPEWGGCFPECLAVDTCFLIFPCCYCIVIMINVTRLFFGNAFSQNSAVRNEQGMYIGMQWTPFARWKLSAYADVFRFPWLKYGVDARRRERNICFNLIIRRAGICPYMSVIIQTRENITPYHQQRCVCRPYIRFLHPSRCGHLQTVFVIQKRTKKAEGG